MRARRNTFAEGPGGGTRPARGCIGFVRNFPDRASTRPRNGADGGRQQRLEEGAGSAGWPRTPRRLGEVDGFGRYGMLEDTADGLRCHECRETFTHLGLHVYRRHGITAAVYRIEHGLLRPRGLVTSELREKLAAQAAANEAVQRGLALTRDPSRAGAIRRALARPPGLTRGRRRTRPTHGHRGPLHPKGAGHDLRRVWRPILRTARIETASVL